VDDAERQRHERRVARDRRRREQGKPTYFETEATLDSWPVALDPSERSTTILRPRRDRRGELVELEAEALDQEGNAMQVAAPAPAAERPDTSGNLTRSGVIFAVATGLSRLIGLVREIVQAALFGISGPVNAFEIAFLIPNTVRSLVADSALSAAFVPVFSDLLVKGERKRAWRVASSLFWLMLLGLGGLTALFVVVAPWFMAIFGYGPADKFGALAAGLARVLFPLVLVLGLTGIVVGILNSYDHFSVPALSPVAWNLVILLGLALGAEHSDHSSTRLYYYAVAILIATIVQFLLPLPWLRGRDDRLRMVIDIHDPAVKRTFMLMLPVTIGLGLININALVDTFFAARLVDRFQAPSSINAAFRLYMLPQGMFSVAVATVLFPSLARLVSRNDIDGFRRTVASGMRQIAFLLVPASVVSAVLAEPIVRLVYQRGDFTPTQTPVVAACLAAFSLGLVFNGFMLMLNRAFFSLQEAWMPTWVALGNLGLNAALDASLYRVGIWGIPLATSLVNIAGTAALLVLLRRRLGLIDFSRTVVVIVRVALASLPVAAISYGIWRGLDEALGRSFIAQVASVGTSLAAATVVYLAVCRALGVRELDALLALRARFRRA
jgi:putative peptidoglycan lipid II flippase